MYGDKSTTITIPCNVGQVVFVISNKDDKFKPCVYISKVSSMNIKEWRGENRLTVRVDGLFDHYKHEQFYGGASFRPDAFGNSVFFTLDDVKRRLNNEDFILYYAQGYEVHSKEISGQVSILD